MSNVVRIARCHLDRLAAAWPMLDDHRDNTLTRRSPTTRHLGRAAALTLDDLIRVERGGRLSNERKGLHPLPASPTPVDLGLLDAEQLTVGALVELSWLAASTLRTRNLGWPPIVQDVPTMIAWLRLTVAMVPANLAQATADGLGAAWSALETALGLGATDEQIWHSGDLWVTALRGAELLHITAATIRQWHARRYIVDQHGNDVTLLRAGRRWYPMRALRATRDQRNKQAA